MLKNKPLINCWDSDFLNFLVKLNIDIKSKEIIAKPDIVSKGFGYLENNLELIEEINSAVTKESEICLKEGIVDKNYFGYQIENCLKTLIFGKTKKRPIIEIIF